MAHPYMLRSPASFGHRSEDKEDEVLGMGPRAPRALEPAALATSEMLDDAVDLAVRLADSPAYFARPFEPARQSSAPSLL
mmetsp:Transcript_579/g.2119  ORF Transcript_579/g.2119 Transcript_579/m.2119 type:complete len:80 (-) Transcript_579:412-651(-)